MENRLNSIKAYLEQKEIVCTMGTEEIRFQHELSGRITMCHMVIRPAESHVEVIARLPFRVQKEEYGTILYALMDLNRMMVRGGFELEPHDDSVRFRVCVMGRGAEPDKEPERVGTAIQYCEQMLGRYDTRLMEILSNHLSEADSDNWDGYRSGRYEGVGSDRWSRYQSGRYAGVGSNRWSGYRSGFSAGVGSGARSGYRSGRTAGAGSDRWDSYRSGSTYAGKGDESDKDETYNEDDTYDESDNYEQYSDEEGYEDIYPYEDDDVKSNSLLDKFLYMVGLKNK